MQPKTEGGEHDPNVDPNDDFSALATQQEKHCSIAAHNELKLAVTASLEAWYILIPS
jgi:hypothetical protein